MKFDLVGDPPLQIITSVKEYMTKYSLPEHDVAVLLWTTQMSGMDWNKKEELVADQALKHLKQYTPLLEAFTTTPRAEVALLVKVQEFCYDNMNFMKVFQKIVILFYKTDVLSEDSILKWYKGAHSPKGKSVFLDQMKRFVDWLQSAEEGEERTPSSGSRSLTGKGSGLLPPMTVCCTRSRSPAKGNDRSLEAEFCILSPSSAAHEHVGTASA